MYRPREVTVMIILLTLIAAVITGVPLAAVVLVTVASWREETARSIAGRAPGLLTDVARRLLAFHAAGIGRPAGRGRTRRRVRSRVRSRSGRPAGTGILADPDADDDLVLAEDDDLMLAGGT
jgi:hypothetical protein